MAKRNYAAFDLETAGDIPEGGDWQEHRPLGITCAALYAPELGEPVTWYGADPDGEIADTMNREQLALMVRQLEALQSRRGFTIVTWNGLGFDFNVLAEESGMNAECRVLALEHVDMMFHVLCKRGHPLGLETAAQGMKVQGKTEGMDGEKAVRMWREGQREEVIDYCAPGHPQHTGGCHRLRGGEKSPVDQPGRPQPVPGDARRMAHRQAGAQAPRAEHRLDDRPDSQGEVHRMADGGRGRRREGRMKTPGAEVLEKSPGRGNGEAMPDGGCGRKDIARTGAARTGVGTPRPETVKAARS